MKKNLLFFLLKMGRGYRHNILIALIATLVVTVCGIVNVDIIRRLVDTFSIEGTGYNLTKLLITIFIVVMIGVVFKYLLGINVSRYSLGIVYNIREKVIHKLAYAKMTDLNKLHSGDIIGILNNNLSAIETFMSGSFISYFSVPLTIALSIIFLAVLNWQLMIASFISTPIAMVAVHFITKPIAQYAERYYNTLGKENELISDTLEGLVIIKSFGMHNGLLEKYRKIINVSKKQGLKMDFRNIIVLPLVIIMNELPFIICAIYGGFMAVNGQITPGGLIAFLQLLRMLIGPTTQVMNLISSYRGATGAANQLFTLLNLQQENADTSRNTSNQEKICLEFKNVDFSYESNVEVIKKMSFRLNPSEKVAFVGESGAGKSTIIDLICRLYDPLCGEIYFGGEDARKLDTEDIRANISVVSQEPYIFSGTIEENIRCGCREASYEDVIEVAKRAQIHNYIESLPDKYKTVITESENYMSGGEKQRLAIARALLRKTKILLLDEPTSSLDYQTEKQIIDEIYSLFHDSLIVLVTHRLSTLKYCDRIFVIHNGKIVENGSTSELMQLQGHFYNLYAEQRVEDNRS